MKPNKDTESCTIQRAPVRIPAPGDKLIEEYFGRISTGDGGFSIAHMVAPPGWSEPPQTPEFEEMTIVVRGRMQVKTESETHIIAAGEVIRCKPGATIQYSNPFDEENEYWAVCLPAFSPDTVNRKDE